MEMFILINTKCLSVMVMHIMNISEVKKGRGLKLNVTRRQGYDYEVTGPDLYL